MLHYRCKNKTIDKVKCKTGWDKTRDKMCFFSCKDDLEKLHASYNICICLYKQIFRIILPINYY